MLITEDVFRKNNVVITGNPVSARTLLFVHGFGTDQTAWSQIVPAFSEDYRIVLIDNVGAGKSAPQAFVENRYHTLEKYADDLLDICDMLDLQNIILAGHSAGAMISVLAAVRAPTFFSKIVMIGASPRYLNDHDYVGGLTSADIRDIYDAIQHDHWEWAQHFSSTAMQNQEQPHLAEHFANTIRNIPSAQILTVLRSILQGDYRETVVKLNLPALIIQSQNDAFVPIQVAEYLHQNIKSSQLKVIEATGHLPHISAPQAVTDAMAEFIRTPETPQI